MTIILNWDRVCQKFMSKVQWFEDKFDATAQALLTQIELELSQEDDDLLSLTPDGTMWLLDITDKQFLQRYAADIDEWTSQLNSYLRTQTNGKLHIEDADGDCITISYAR